MHDPEYPDDLIDLALLHRVAERSDHELQPNSSPNIRFMRWLEHYARTQQSLHERAATAEAAVQFAQRLRTNIRAATVSATLPVAPLQVCDAPVVGTIEQVASAALQERCAPWLDTLAVAAGAGRALWDEPCERWVELPKGVARAPYVALNVAGDSMLPVLVPGDVLLVRIGKPAKVGALVVALHSDHGYVVKHVARIEPTVVELTSFNSEYAPLRIANDVALVLGTVTHVLRRGCNRSSSM